MIVICFWDWKLCLFVFFFIIVFVVLSFCNIQTEMEMMREVFSKLLLGKDMSGSGKGVCTAMAISNAITNLCGMFNFQLYSNFLVEWNPFFK